MTIAFPSESTSATAISAPEAPPTRKLALSEKRLAANRANARKSTGPRTPAGKKTVSQNATVHGLTSATPPPPLDPSYSTRLYELKEEHRPTTPSQIYLVEQLAHIAWKLDQIPKIEAHLLAAASTANSQSTIDNLTTLFLQDKPTPLTRLWDLHRRLLAQFQSILRQLPRLRQEATKQHQRDDEAQKRQDDLARAARIDHLCAEQARNLPAFSPSPALPPSPGTPGEGRGEGLPSFKPPRSLAVSHPSTPNAPAQNKPTTPHHTTDQGQLTTDHPGGPDAK